MVQSVAESMRLDGRVSLIVGGHGALADPCARALAEQGCTIVLAARTPEKCADLAARIHDDLGSTVEVETVDVADEQQVRDLLRRVLERHGRLDVVVNNAATYWASPPESLPVDRGWRRVLDVNLTGAFLVCQAAGEVMLRAGGGVIINMASSAAFISFLPDVGSTPSYTVSKGALVTLTRDLAVQWAARGVRVNAIAPGSMDAGMMDSVPDERRARMLSAIPAGRFGKPEEIKGAVAYLASDAASYVTGLVLRVDGGQTRV